MWGGHFQSESLCSRFLGISSVFLVFRKKYNMPCVGGHYLKEGLVVVRVVVGLIL